MAEQKIHSTAIIEKTAELGTNARVGPYCYIGPHVQLGDDCELRNHVTITGHTRIGKANVFFANCVVGEIPQDLKYRGEPTQTVIGDDNHFREFVTVHAGTEVGGGVTRIGSHNRFLIGVHLAHDVVLGNHVVISNHVQIAGHVHIEDFVTMGGQVGIHQFVTVGRYAFIGGQSPVSTDVMPYLITTGHPPEVRGVNSNGLKRWNLTATEIEVITDAYRLLFAKSSATQGPLAERLRQLADNSYMNSQHVSYLCEFLNRTLLDGKFGRYLESCRQDKPQDHREFYTKKKETSR